MKLPRDNPTFCLMNTKADATTKFQFLEAYLIIIRVCPILKYLRAHNTVLSKGLLKKYNLTKFELKLFMFSSGSKYLYIDNAVLRQLPKRLLFTMLKNKDFMVFFKKKRFIYYTDSVCWVYKHKLQNCFCNQIE
jgi:hypothetical protein